MSRHICLVFHCLTRGTGEDAAAHKELFVPVSDIEVMIRTFKEEGYEFVWPMDVSNSRYPTCSVTFDDGYFNNSYFLDVAERYRVPLVLFVNSYNIVNRTPFIWDLWEVAEKGKWRLSAFDYRKMYDKITSAEKDRLDNENHRSFTVEELEIFGSHPLVYLAPHSHTHQPLVGQYIRAVDHELQENLSFLRGFSHTLLTDFSLPCGLSTRRTRRMLLDRFERIYTVNGGGFSSTDRVINRISLINPQYGGDLYAQVKKSFLWTSKLRKKMVNIRYSHRVLNRW
ncbi:hypothetical protein ES707_04016 [subsurface metagenome]